MKLISDMSSILWTALMAGLDPEHYESELDGKKVKVNTAAYGYENVVNSINAALNRFNCTPIDLILVREGVNSKFPRISMFKDYKAKKENRSPAHYDEFNKLVAKVIETYGNLGALVVRQDNVEADDVIAWLAKYLDEDCVVHTNDNDLVALTGLNSRGYTINTYVGGELNVNKYGLFPTKFITLYKAMVGDTKDNIKGIPNFGPAAWVQFHAEFGEDGMAEMTRLAELGSLQELEEEAEQNKMIAKIYDARAEFLLSYRLAKLRPEWVQTMQNAVEFYPGLCLGTAHQDERLSQWQPVRMLVTASKWDAFLPRFKAQALARPWLAMDIETSTPDESDEWLTAQGNPDGVDVIGSELTGMSLTFGTNMQCTVYIPIDHAETENVTKAQVFELMQWIAEQKLQTVIHSTQFEGTVLYNEFGAQWKDNGFNGLIPNWLDTKLEASYVDENDALGLKKLSKKWFNYDQVEYKAVTTIDNVQYKMRELSGKHVFDYACDDTVCTAGFHNFARTFMGLEGSYSVYLDVEIDSAYLHCQSFIHGLDVSVKRIKELEEEDDAIAAEAWTTVRGYLIANGWEGTVTPVYSADLTAAQVKEAYLIVKGEKLDTAVRTVTKLIDMIKPLEPLLAACLEKTLTGDYADLNTLIASKFKGEPDFNSGSSKQMAELMYDTMGLPKKLFNKPTAQMKAAKIKQGNVKADALAVAYAMIDAPPELAEVLEALRLMKMVETRKGLYYSPYPYFVHWKTGKVHSSHNQCDTNTRRASSSKPNMQQLGKNEKVVGFVPKVREMIVPHKKNAVVVSMDFMAQELRIIADYSRDNNMLDCYIGENLKDLHALTGLGIYNTKNGTQMEYSEFIAILSDTSHALHKQVKKARSLGKQTNFTTEFGAMAPKLAMTIMVPEAEAQTYLEAKEAATPMVVEWKAGVIAEAKQAGYVRTKLGAVRHLRELLQSPDWSTATKAERQSVNFKVQSSAAEMTKKAEGRMFKANLEQRFDCMILVPVHDEVIASIAIEDLYECLPAMHSCMEQPYGDMIVPIKSSISFGKSFGPAHQIEIGDMPTKEAIEYGLNKLKEFA